VRAGSSHKNLRRQRETDADAVVEEIVSDARRDNDRINPGCRGFYRATDVGPHIIGPDQKMMQTGAQARLQQGETVAETNSTVLIYGETGTGKELIARDS